MMFADAEDAHVAAAPDQLRAGHGLGDTTRPEVGALKECLDDADLLVFKEAAKIEGGAKGGEIVGTTQRQKVDRTGRRDEAGALWMGRERQDRDTVAVLRQERGEFKNDALSAAECSGELVD